MNMNMIPAAKRTKLFEGAFAFDALRIFTIGDGSSFARALNALLPEVCTQEVAREDANVILSVSHIYSGKLEYCAIRILADRIEIRCRDAAGARNAACILAQLMISNRVRDRLPCGSVEDWPDASYRGIMVESARGWTPMEQIYTMIRHMALSRMNQLQFHFTGLPGCTIALDCFPDWPGFGEENLKYTKDEIRAMIAYAADLGISVCPFIQTLTHARALAQVAGLLCPGDDDPAQQNCVCVGQERTFAVIETVLAEVAELFPDQVIHIGCDEYDMTAVSPRTCHWDQCPHCQALAKRKGFTCNRDIFIYAAERINQIVNKLGKVSIIWNADLKPGNIPDSLERNILIHYYRHDFDLGKEKHFGLSIDGYIEDGFAVLNSNFRSTYLDAYMNAERTSHWSFINDPMVAPENMGGIIGGCCCIWGGYSFHKHFDQTIAPGIFLFADRLWNSFERGTLYDEKFSTLLTTLMFDARLPEGMDVFAAIGQVLPPTVDAKERFFPRGVAASPEELDSIVEALDALGDDMLAKAYARTAREAAERRRELLAASPLKKTLQFEG